MARANIWKTPWRWRATEKIYSRRWRLANSFSMIVFQLIWVKKNQNKNRRGFSDGEAFLAEGFFNAILSKCISKCFHLKYLNLLSFWTRLSRDGLIKVVSGLRNFQFPKTLSKFKYLLNLFATPQNFQATPLRVATHALPYTGLFHLLTEKCWEESLSLSASNDNFLVRIASWIWIQVKSLINT